MTEWVTLLSRKGQAWGVRAGCRGGAGAGGAAVSLAQLRSSLHSQRRGEDITEEYPPEDITEEHPPEDITGLSLSEQIAALLAKRYGDITKDPKAMGLHNILDEGAGMME